ncbi:ribosome recycling factor [Candidatus Falkowbacteria bacterium]|jgi:ribosome recycling factor|nr:ribosome recycling factor [Candidatus Falkowbacteria bacterium]MBT5503329.1 ribosome recycling factor [Candidatus Falkowbacteria bacterium]MBT6573660.1 ribosome recycling factor [Candidatus Falkowbacteria bacterium]MBT7348267.1 ribosome recycling factor [Candidatus Falkowbacteria bacterium]MBT7500131.1 ribosome recycling factor [Candidatus Falkowbacteria bacterium]
MSNQYIEQHEGDFKKGNEHFEKELATIRAGRANPAMLENILVDAYGVKTPINQLSSISVPEARVMTVEPWDKNLLKEVEKAITYADLGVGVSGESTLVRVTVPQMTEENRKEMVRGMNEKLEAAKVAVRSVREKVKEAIISGEKSNEITEDDKYAYIKELDEKVQTLNKQLQELAEDKEKEIMSV